MTGVPFAAAGSDAGIRPLHPTRLCCPGADEVIEWHPFWLRRIVSAFEI
jgi:hypothetical protein